MTYQESDFEYLGDSYEYDNFDDLAEECDDTDTKFIEGDYIVVDGSVYKIKKKPTG